MAKTIYQGMDIAFHAVDVKDCIVLHELMNQLVEGINILNVQYKIDRLPKEEQKEYEYPWHSIYIDNDKAEAIHKVLSDLGFVSTKDIIPFENINLDFYRKK